MATPVQPDLFFHEGRGPELQTVHWTRSGRVLRAIDYFTPDDIHEPAALMHVLFERAQVVMRTPEEVVGPAQVGEWIARLRPAALFDLGQSPWFTSFAPRHLVKCSHFQLLFCDELFDVICEGIRCVRGAFPAADAG